MRRARLLPAAAALAAGILWGGAPAEAQYPPRPTPFSGQDFSQPGPQAAPEYQPQQYQQPQFQQPQYQQPQYQQGQFQQGPAPSTFAPPPTSAPPGTGPARPRPQLGLFSPAQIVARVGNEPILQGELIGNAGEELTADQLEQVLQQTLVNAIDTKLVYLDFLRTAPKDRLPDIEKQIAEAFNESQLEMMMKKAKVKTPLELDAVLRESGNSLAKQRRMFTERVIAQSTMRRNVNQSPDVTNDEIRRYYQEHAADFAIPAQARWEKLTARFAQLGGRDAAWQAIAAMGNEVLGGAPLSAVAKRSSQSLDAEDGGLHDWTGQGSLRSKPIDEALFTLPLNRLSRVIEDEEGFHIVRVLERRDAGAVPFTEAQVKIKEKITEQKIIAETEKYLTRLRQITSVWTVFDEPSEVARPESVYGPR